MKKILITTLLLVFSLSITHAQEKKVKEEQEVKLNVKVKDGAEPDVYVDGKKFEFSVDLIDPDKIATVNVMKGDEAMEIYNAPNGVILITTKEKAKERQTSTFIIENYKDDEKVTETKIRIRSDQPTDPLIIIDGEQVSQAELKKLSPEDILTIDVIKDEKASKEYDSETGVIIIKTKKHSKEAKESKVEK